MIEDRYDKDELSDSDRPKQIAASSHNDLNDDGNRAYATETFRDINDHDDNDHDRDQPTLQKEPSFQRFAPLPGNQVQSSNIPIYPSIPGRSSAPTSQQPQQSSSSLPPIVHDPAYHGQGGPYR